MKKAILIIGCMVLMINAVAAQAASSNKPVYTWTCEDFLAVDESMRPQVISFAEGLNRMEQPEEAIVDVHGILKVVPIVGDRCMQNPTSSFTKELKSSWDQK